LKGVSLARAAGDIFASVLLFEAVPEGRRPSLAAFRSQVLGLLEDFGRSPQADQATPQDVAEARFALVAWIDEKANLAGWKGSAEWNSDPLQLQLFGTRRAGVEFFEHLEKLRPENAAALEIYFLCLALGFQGDYTGREGERRVVVSRTYEKLRRVERALDLAREKRLTPAAYQVNIALEERRGNRLARTLLLLASGLLVFFGILLGLLHLMAGGVALPASF
jgi:type VI secretion system protein ImpK